MTLSDAASFPSPTEQPVIRVADPGALIAAVPVLLGFRPHDSLVLIATGGSTGRRLGLTLRVDLPAARDVDAVCAMAAASLLLDDPAGAVVLVVGGAVADRSRRRTTGPPRPDVVDGVRAVLGTHGVATDLAVWAQRCAGAARWVCYDSCGCAGLVPDPASTESAALAVSRGNVVYADRAELERLVAPVSPKVLRRRNAQLDRTIDAAADGAAMPDVFTGWALVDSAIEDAAAGKLVLDDDAVVALAAALAMPAVRDAALVRSIGPRAAAAEQLWSALARETPDPEAATPAALLAVSALLRGSGALAHIALDAPSRPGRATASPGCCGARPTPGCDRTSSGRGCAGRLPRVVQMSMFAQRMDSISGRISWTEPARRHGSRMSAPTRRFGVTMPLPLPLARAIDAVNPTVGPKPVRWLAVDQLVRTVIDVMQAKSFAKYADKREAMASSPREYYRLFAETADAVSERGAWIDYVADTGDGFSTTLATARCLAGGVEVTRDPSAKVAQVVEFAGRYKRADLLVLGGDEVYPVASAMEYEDRLNYPLRLAVARAEYTAMCDAADRTDDDTNWSDVDIDPPVLALPGNHDWYDGLGSFRRNFCESWTVRKARSSPLGAAEAIVVPPLAERDDVGGWGAFQSRSYFAIQLCPGWWLWAVDSQLDAPIDAEQLSYFRDAHDLVRQDDGRIILCTATPSWLEAQGTEVRKALADKPLYTLLWFIDRVLGRQHRHRIRLVLTGDQHHYARYTPKEGIDRPDFAPELVTCGGGGAFLASTHHLGDHLAFDLQPWPTTEDNRDLRYDNAGCYPDRSTSRSLRWRFLTAAWRNGPTLPLLLGVVDYALFLTIVAHTGRTGWQFLPWLGIVGALLGVYAYAGTTRTDVGVGARRGLSALLGIGHLAAHAAVAALLAVGARHLASVPPGELLPWYVHPVAFVLCAVLGIVVFVSYLQVADFLECHTLEAFSGMRVEGYKSHLRIHATPNGLTIYVLGMKSVPRMRRSSNLDDTAPTPHLVESFDIPRDSPGRPAANSVAPAAADMETVQG